MGLFQYVNSCRLSLPIVFALVACSSPSVNCIHLSGTWNGHTFYKFLTRFGFQQTNMHDTTQTQGYIYGNVTTENENSNVTRRMVLAVVDSEYFLYFFGNRSQEDRTNACASMFAKIDRIAWDGECQPNGEQDFLRRVPCQRGSICVEETDPSNVFPGFQFTYHVRDTSQPRFWYLSFVSCHRDSQTCKWTYDNESSSIVVKYDIWLVNGHPNDRNSNPLEHQFSFEMHDIVELYAAFAIAYTFLLPVQLYALSIQRHCLPLLLTSCMSLEYIGIVLNAVHFSKFAFDGSGFGVFRIMGNFIDMTAQCLFMLLLLLIVKGWMITRRHLSCMTRLVLFSVWTAYTAASIALFLWNQIDVDLISDIDEWQTWPGWLILAFRLFIMMWFLWELRHTFTVERDLKKTKFYLHFGAGFLVWFVYLPLIAFICTYVSSLWRYKTIISVAYSADFLSLCVMVHLLWPSRTYLYFNLDRYEARVNLDGLDFPGLDSFVNGDGGILTAAVDGVSDNDVFDSDSCTATTELVQ